MREGNALEDRRIRQLIADGVPASTIADLLNAQLATGADPWTSEQVQARASELGVEARTVGALGDPTGHWVWLGLVGAALETPFAPGHTYTLGIGGRLWLGTYQRNGDLSLYFAGVSAAYQSYFSREGHGLFVGGQLMLGSSGQRVQQRNCLPDFPNICDSESVIRPRATLAAGPVFGWTGAKPSSRTRFAIGVHYLAPHGYAATVHLQVGIPTRLR